VANVILAAALTPYLGLALYDGYLHDRARRVPKLEQFAHGILGISMAIFLWAVFSRQTAVASIALAIFIFVYSIDEFVFHSGIAKHERAVHAASMLTLTLFVLTWRFSVT
jgi:hypothetical protein